MSADDDVLRALTRLMYGRRGRTIYEYERENSRERIYKTKPWARGRVGSIEKQILYPLPLRRQADDNRRVGPAHL